MELPSSSSMVLNSQSRKPSKRPRFGMLRIFRVGLETDNKSKTAFVIRFFLENKNDKYVTRTYKPRTETRCGATFAFLFPTMVYQATVSAPVNIACIK